MMIVAPNEFLFQSISSFLKEIEEELHLKDTVVIDFTNVVEIDSAGVQVLIALKNETIAQNKKLSLIHISNATDEIFSLYNINQFMEISK